MCVVGCVRFTLCLCAISDLREYWEDLSAKIGDDFHLDSVVGQRNDDILENARSLYDRMFRNASDKVCAWVGGLACVLFSAFVAIRALAAKERCVALVYIRWFFVDAA